MTKDSENEVAEPVMEEEPVPIVLNNDWGVEDVDACWQMKVV